MHFKSYTGPFLNICLFILFYTSCRTAQKGELLPAITKHETVTDHPELSYDVYIPSHLASCAKMPLMLIIDPHGQVEASMKRFEKLAETYHLILACSNQIQNNVPGYMLLIGDITEDLKQKTENDGSIYLAGFSGGARMALAYASENTTSGVLACGALSSDEEIRKCKSMVYAISGMSDFNFGESARFVLKPEACPTNFYLEINNNFHTWPDENSLLRAAGFLSFSVQQGKRSCHFDRKEISSFLELADETIDSLNNSRLYYQEMLILKNLEKVNLNNTSGRYAKSAELLINMEDYGNQIISLQKSLQFEYSVREAYQHALMKNDANWWKNEISQLNSQIAGQKEEFQRLALVRIKAFLGIMCYSLSRNSLQQGDLLFAEKILSIYRALEPENPDMFYFSAVYGLKTNEKEGEIAKNLKLALDNGYADTGNMRKTFPESVLELLYEPAF